MRVFKLDEQYGHYVKDIEEYLNIRPGTFIELVYYGNPTMCLIVADLQGKKGIAVLEHDTPFLLDQTIYAYLEFRPYMGKFDIKLVDTVKRD